MLTFCKKLDLRFPSEKDEQAFRAHLALTLIHNTVVGCFIGVTFAFSFWIRSYLQQKTRVDNKFEWNVNDPRVFHAMIMFVGMIMPSLFAICGTLRLRFGFFKSLSIDWETVATLICLTSSPILAFRSRWHMANAWDMDPEVVWGYDVRNSELQMIVVVDLLLTAACLYIPFRSCVLWTIIVACVFQCCGR